MLALVADDDPLSRRITMTALRRAGLACLGFASADDALGALEALGGEAAVVVTDVAMPGSIDGLGLARRVGEDLPGIPVVVVSGDRYSVEAASAIPAVVAALEKPFRPDELAGAVLRAAASSRDRLEPAPWQAEDPRR